MMAGALVRKYARSLAEVALEQGNQERVRADLGKFERLYRENSELRNVLENPAISLSAKRKIVNEISVRVQAAQEVVNFLTLLLQNNRIQLLPEIEPAFQDALNEKLGVLTGEVCSSVSLRAEQRAAIEQRLAAMTGKKVRLEYCRDPALIGGIKIRLGSVIYDATVQKQLEEIRRRIV